MAVANHGGTVAPLIAVVDHGHNHVVDDHHLVPGYKQGPDLKKLKIKHQNQIQKTKQNGGWEWDWESYLWVILCQ